MITVAAVLSLIALANAQGAGTITAENHPSLNWQQCTSSGCTNVAGSVTLDSNWRWVHDSSGTNCYTGNTWSTTACPANNGSACAANCYLDGADYTGTYGITASGSSLKLNFVTGSNVGSRVYLLASASQYQMFDLLNKEFTFDVDVSTLPCGLNGALYFSQMDADGGMSRFPTNKAGAKYGTGYCDSQCPKDIKFINGVANIVNWTTSGTNTGTGNTGTCCNEMDIWEANSMDNAVTPHPCKTTQQTACTGSDCTGTTTTGLCDPAGCDFNPYRMGVTDFYGSGKTIDTTKPFTVVTQFITSDGTDTGTLETIRRFYVQNGVTYAQPNANIAGVPASPDLSDSWCSAQKTAFSDTNIFASKGGMAQMGSALKSMVLVLSIWDDHAVNMLWLDSAYPTNLPTTQPGVVRGPCATSSGNPTTVEANGSNVYVTYSNIKFGTLGSTFKAPGGGTSSTSSGSSSSSSSSSSSRSTSHTTTTPTGTCAAHWSQCGGIGFTGPTCCVSGTTCNTVNPYYSQCL